MNGRTGSLIALVGVVLIGMTGFGVFLPIFPFLALHLGGTATEATIAMGCYSLGQLVASPWWGRLSDRVGRKPILIVGLLGGMISYLILARAHTIYELGGARLFGGLMAGNIGAAFASAADLADEKTRARNMGLLGAAVGLAFICGPALGALLIGGGKPDAAAFSKVCLVSAALAGAAALTALLLYRESLPKESRRAADAPRPRRVNMLLTRPVLARFILVMFVMITAQAMLETIFGLWADATLSWGPRQVGWALAGLGVGAVLLQGGGAGRAARMLGERVTLLIGIASMIAGFAGMAVTHTEGVLIASLGAMVLGIGLSTPALNSLVAAQAEADERGAVMGLSQSASAFGRVAGPLMSGVVFDSLGHGAPFVAGAILLLGALFVAQSEPARVAGEAT
ncbi:MAG TPA: MFS transporter [Vitreimonas sp.]|jgi:DHA1 family tetracycline resistance protein-like MFS transporter|nr:MFS transporter [Vitreimonas sp.]